MFSLLDLQKELKKGDKKTQEKIAAYYLANTKYINNWDPGDLTSPNIVGQYVLLYYDNSTKAR